LIGREGREFKTSGERLLLDYQEVDGVRFPATIKFVEPGEFSMEVQKITLMKTHVDEARFAVPEGAAEFRTCRDVQPARLLRRVESDYQPMARIAHIQGTVRVQAIIQEDGTVGQIKLISGHPILSQAAIDAFKQWKYSPATCPNGPVAQETELKATFTIR
jgi:TonB family protein